jgi:outer membrane lipoprotein LolB
MRWAAWIPTLLLVGCTTVGPSAPAVAPESYAQHEQSISGIRWFAFNGRVAVLTSDKGFSGRMRWHHHPDGDDISFYSPLGSQLGQITAGADGVTLQTSDQKSYRAEDTQALMQQTLGWSLPLTDLTDWVLGRPTHGQSQILAWDAAGNITHMRQQEWDIEYAQYMEVDGKQLPGKISLKSAPLNLKLVIEQWIGAQTPE